MSENIQIHPNEDDYLMISGIQHFAFCRRQWALIHIEHMWADNFHTTRGELMHERVHDPTSTQKRKDIITATDMPVVSHELRITGKCDVVEFLRDNDGVAIHGRTGLWIARPIEYKSGRSKASDADRLQLCAQAICLEEMLTCPKIDTAYLYYGAVRRREEVRLTQELRDKVAAMFAEMRGYFERGYTPRVKPSKACKSCSLADMCLPNLRPSTDVAKYIEEAMSDGGMP